MQKETLESLKAGLGIIELDQFFIELDFSQLDPVAYLDAEGMYTDFMYKQQESLENVLLNFVWTTYGEDFYLKQGMHFNSDIVPLPKDYDAEKTKKDLEDHGEFSNRKAIDDIMYPSGLKAIYALVEAPKGLLTDSIDGIVAYFLKELGMFVPVRIECNENTLKTTKCYSIDRSEYVKTKKNLKPLDDHTLMFEVEFDIDDLDDYDD